MEEAGEGEGEGEGEVSEKVEEQTQLPHDLITQHIFTKLPIKSLLLFKSLSKQWYSTLSSFHFAHTHFNFSPFSHSSFPTQFLFIQNRNKYYLFSYNDDDNDNNKKMVELGLNFHNESLVLIGTCNGLVCLASFTSCFFILWNPITTQFCKYSDPDLDSSINCRVSWGFGYVPITNDYKVVMILEMLAIPDIKVHVFSLKSKKWTRIDNELYQDIIFTNVDDVTEIENGEGSVQFTYLFQARQGVLVNETLYWIVTSKGCNWGRQIFAFDLVLETFHIVVDLNLVSNDVYRDKFLCVLGGCLSKVGVNQRDDVYIEILKGPGKVDSLHLSRDLRLRSCQGIVGFTRTGKFYILMEDSTIGICDSRSQPMKYTPLVTFESLGKSRVASYVPSLFLPYTIG